MQLWASRHHQTGLVALTMTVERADSARRLPVRVRVVDADVAATAEALARSDAETARGLGHPVRVDLDQLVARAEASSAPAESDDRS